MTNFQIQKKNFKWCKESLFCDDVSVETYFSTAPQYYFGDPNAANFEDFDDPALHMDLPRLSFNPSKKDRTNISDIVGHEQELGDYYRYLIEKAYAQGHNFNSIRQYFWMRGALVSKSKNVSVSFPWYDTASEFSGIHTWIMSAQESEEFFDIDQGWMLSGVCLNERLFLLETDDSNFCEPHLSKVFANICFDREAIRLTLAENKCAVVNVIGKLSSHIGVDVWTEYRYDEDVEFGTADWNPR